MEISYFFHIVILNICWYRQKHSTSPMPTSEIDLHWFRLIFYYRKWIFGFSGNILYVHHTSRTEFLRFQKDGVKCFFLDWFSISDAGLLILKDYSQISREIMWKENITIFKSWFRHETFSFLKSVHFIFFKFSFVIHIVRHLGYDLSTGSFLFEILVSLSFSILYARLEVQVHFWWFRNGPVFQL
jgi:hypothetical protein